MGLRTVGHREAGLQGVWRAAYRRQGKMFYEKISSFQVLGTSSAGVIDDIVHWIRWGDAVTEREIQGEGRTSSVERAVEKLRIEPAGELAP